MLMTMEIMSQDKPSGTTIDSMDTVYMLAVGEMAAYQRVLLRDSSSKGLTRVSQVLCLDLLV